MGAALSEAFAGPEGYACAAMSRAPSGITPSAFDPRPALDWIGLDKPLHPFSYAEEGGCERVFRLTKVSNRTIKLMSATAALAITAMRFCRSLSR